MYAAEVEQAGGRWREASDAGRGHECDDNDQGVNWGATKDR